MSPEALSHCPVLRPPRSRAHLWSFCPLLADSRIGLFRLPTWGWDSQVFNKSKGHIAEPGFCGLSVLLTWHCPRSSRTEANPSFMFHVLFCWNQWLFPRDWEGQSLKKVLFFNIFAFQEKCRKRQRLGDMEFSPCEIQISIHTVWYKVHFHTVKYRNTYPQR